MKRSSTREHRAVISHGTNCEKPQKVCYQRNKTVLSNLCNSLKDWTTTEIFNSNEALLRSLINDQVPGN